jgi:hypothetical protein
MLPLIYCTGTKLGWAQQSEVFVHAIRDFSYMWYVEAQCPKSFALMVSTSVGIIRCTEKLLIACASF